MNTQEKELYYLSELSDYKVDSGYSDISGWNVKDSALRTIGTVNNLLVNIKTERVVYIDVEVDNSIIDAKHDPYGRPANAEIREFINEKGENHIIIPIGLVEINSSEKYVFAELIDHKTFAETKRIRRDTPIEREYENAILDSYKRKYPKTTGNKNAPSDLDANHGESETTNKPLEVDSQQIFEEKKAAENFEETNKDDPFYGKTEFDDARFLRGKK